MVTYDSLCGLVLVLRLRRTHQGKAPGFKSRPLHSPDMSPIELAFAKLKSHPRQAAARTLDELQGAVARSLSQFQPDHCRGFLRHAQYAAI